MINEGKVGPQTNSDGSQNTIRTTKDGSTAVANALADYQELAVRGQVFQGANQGPGGTTTTVGLATTYTGLCLNNPVNSGKNLVLLGCGFSIVGAPAALSTIGLMGGYTQAGVVTHTTPLVPLSTFLNQNVATGVAKVDSACTLPTAPTVLEAFGTIPITGATAQVVNPPFSGGNYDFKGAYIIPPGGYVAIYTSTVVTIIGSFKWAEVPA